LLLFLLDMPSAGSDGAEVRGLSSPPVRPGAACARGPPWWQNAARMVPWWQLRLQAGAQQSEGFGEPVGSPTGWWTFSLLKLPWAS